uniref:Uncharacterized protein n=1 Tax=Oryza meridionalis TaxID=40149 RepID=A0A0E0FAE9_9ORYZ
PDCHRRCRHHPLPTDTVRATPPPSTPPPPSSPSATTIHSSNSSSAAAASFSTGGGGLPSPFPDFGAPLSATNTSSPSLQGWKPWERRLRWGEVGAAAVAGDRRGVDACGFRSPPTPQDTDDLKPPSTSRCRHLKPPSPSPTHAQGRAARAAPADAVPDVVELSVAKNKFKAFDLGGHQIARLLLLSSL